MSTVSPPATVPAVAEQPVAPRGLLPVVLTATFMSALDFFIVNVAIPAVQRDLHAGASAIQWVMAGYALALAGGLITAGRLGDLLGRRRMFSLGLAVFTLASAACGLATGPAFLIAARVVQGLGAALMGPQVLALLRTGFHGAAQAKAFASYALTLGLGAVLGQLIGGVLIRADLFGTDWRACFLINVPVGLATLVLVPRTVPESRAPQRPSLDLPGVLLVTAALVTLALPLIQGRASGWPAWTWVSLGGSAVLWTALARHQVRLAGRGGSPLVHPHLFRTRAFSAGMLAQLAFWLGQASFFLVLAIYLQQGRGLDALGSGTVFTALGAGYLATSLNAHRVAARLGRQAVALGAVLMAGGLAALRITVDSGAHSALWLVPALILDGLGMGLVIAPLTGSALAGVPTHLVGSASGTVATVQQVGGALGVALIGILFYGAPTVRSGFGTSLLALTVLELALAATVQLLPAARARRGGSR
ncbi:MFS transporter [Kitasatospora sp. NPDC049285]|uniref:MFS transporter n=1 Tax=Kitasatospora sp. NPDC049285 TaxID=3157096 RepID=UPI003416DB75